MEQGLTALLNTDTALGREMRRIARQLSDWEIDGTLRLRQGAPGWQLRLEVSAGHYDLVVMGADRSNRCLRWLIGGHTTPLLRLTSQPVLIAKPAPEPEADGCD
jgi:nucleotide-binding universal stress UspA family protein